MMKSNSQNITNLAIGGIQWKFLSTVSFVIMQLILGIALARLLPPKDFGIYGYVMIFVGFISIYTQAGIAPAIIQRKHITDEHLKVGFTLSVLIGLIATIALCVLAPLFTKGLETSILRILSLTFIISGIGSVSGALLEKKVNFKILFLVEICSYLVGQGVIAIGLAMAGFGVWALVVGILFYIIIRNLTLLIISPYPFSFSLKTDKVKELMHFGFGLSLARLANYGAQNGGYFVIGRLLAPEALGLYARAYQLATIPAGNVASLVTSVLFPVYSIVQDDKNRLKKGFYLSISLVSFLIIPSLACLSFAAKRLIPFVYGAAWNGCIPSLQILCVCGVLTSMYTLADAISRAKGLVYAQLVRHSIYAVMVLIGSVLGVTYGIEGVAIAGSMAVFVMYLMLMQLGKNIVDGTWHDILKAHIPGVIIGIFVTVFSLVALWAGDTYKFSDLFVLLILFVALPIIYLFCFAFFPLRWLGEIPEFLVNNYSSFFPAKVADFLKNRIRMQAIGQLRT
jgi:O-antigen/teichoic acid export membrane protein